MAKMYVECAVSKGKGTLVSHFVADCSKPPFVDLTGKDFITQRINKREYDAFITEHGSERAV